MKKLDVKYSIRGVAANHDGDGIEEKDKEDRVIHIFGTYLLKDLSADMFYFITKQFNTWSSGES